MAWVILSSITLIGSLTGIYTLVKDNKIRGIILLLLAAVCPIVTGLFCSLKESRVFGGTDWEFIVHSAVVDADPLPWFILILLLAEIVFIIWNIKNRRN